MKRPNATACLLAGALCAPAAQAATITVGSLADNTTLDGQVTLREAIIAANTDTSVDGSAAGSGSDEIVFATGPGTILLGGTALPLVTDGLTITGPGADRLALDAGGTSRILEIQVGVVASLSGLTLRNGAPAAGHGGAVLNAGTLTLTRCVLSDNESGFAGDGGAVWSGGSLTIAESTLERNRSGRGGALANVGDATVIASSFVLNNASRGGAIGNQGTLAITNSTAAGNSSTITGGAIILGVGASLTATASTIASNRALTGAGGGIDARDGSLLLRGTIVARNLSGAANPTPQDVAGAAQGASADNVIGVDTGLTGISHGTNGNQIGTAASPLDPLLGLLADNGGPTLTYALRPGSPALDRGSAATCPPVDQRGTPRPLDGDNDSLAACDVGAFELFAVDAAASSYFTVPPCRLVDTRGPPGPAGRPALAANTSRVFPLAGLCGVPPDARAVVLNVTVTRETDAGDLRPYPAGGALPATSTINFVAGRPRAGNAILPLGTGGLVTVHCVMPFGSAGTADVVLDVYGYFR